MEGGTKRRTKQPVKCIYKSDNVRVFSVSLPAGEFTVLDYNYLMDIDIEVYYTDRMIQVKPHESEYKAANKAVREFFAAAK